MYFHKIGKFKKISLYMRIIASITMVCLIAHKILCHFSKQLKNSVKDTGDNYMSYTFCNRKLLFENMLLGMIQMIPKIHSIFEEIIQSALRWISTTSVWPLGRLES